MSFFLFVAVNISLSTDAKIETHQRLTSNKARPKSLRPFGARLKSLAKPMQHFQSIKRTGKSDESSISLPVQLGTPGGMYSLGVKIRNLKVDFKTAGTWRRVRQ